MEKSIVIIGNVPNSDKTEKSIELAKSFAKNEVEFIRINFKGSIINTFLFRHCTDETKLVIVDEIQEIVQIEEILTCTDGKLLIQKLGKVPTEISVKIMLVCNRRITKKKLLALGESFSTRFDVIECNEKDINH